MPFACSRMDFLTLLAGSSTLAMLGCSSDESSGSGTGGGAGTLAGTRSDLSGGSAKRRPLHGTARRRGSSSPELLQRVREVPFDAREVARRHGNAPSPYAQDHRLARLFGGGVVADPVRGDAQLVEDPPVVDLL